MVRKFLLGTTTTLLFFIGLGQFLGISGRALESAASVIMYPFLKVQRRISSRIRSWSDRKRTHHSVIAELEHALARQEDLQKEIIELKAFIDYEKHTKELRDFLERYKTDKALIAQVLLKQYEPSHMFLLDAGARKGVTKGMIAVYRDCLVGKVIEVYPYYCELLLITDPACKVAAFCAESGVRGIHEGIKRLDMTKLSYVDHLAELKENDLVLTSGEGTVFPRGFGLGAIKQWEQDGYTCAVTIEPLINTRRIEYCCLLDNIVELKPEEEPKPELFNK